MASRVYNGYIVPNLANLQSRKLVPFTSARFVKEPLYGTVYPRKKVSATGLIAGAFMK